MCSRRLGESRKHKAFHLKQARPAATPAATGPRATAATRGMSASGTPIECASSPHSSPPTRAELSLRNSIYLLHEGMSAKVLIGALGVIAMSPPYSVPPAQRSGGFRASYGSFAAGGGVGLSVSAPLPSASPPYTRGAARAGDEIRMAFPERSNLTRNHHNVWWVASPRTWNTPPEKRNTVCRLIR